MAGGPYSIDFSEHFDAYLAKVPDEVRRIFFKRMENKYKTYPNFEHKRGGVPFYSDRIEGGKYRVCFTQNQNQRVMVFIGDHKAYDTFLAEWSNKFQ